MWYIIAGVVVFSIIGVSHQRNNAKKNKIRRSFFDQNYESILNAQKDFRALCDLKGPYFSNHRLTEWKTRHETILSAKEEALKFDDFGFPSEKISIIKDFIGISLDPEGHRKRFNDDFLSHELKRTEALLNDVDGKFLDHQQREAIIRDEDNSLVIAGAGCGKTTTILGKVKYLVEQLEVSPEQLLLISFTRKSAEDLSRKVNLSGVNISTFHKLGLDIIKAAGNAPPSIYNQNRQVFLEREFQNQLENEDYLAKTVKYFSDYIKVEKDDFDFKDSSENIQHLKDQDYRPFKQKREFRNGIETYRREIVKSQQECKLANFLLFHGVNYEYEAPYEIDTKTPDRRQYAPDFSIYQGDMRIYLEHFGVDENGNVPQFFVKEDQTYAQANTLYINAIEWKMNLHMVNNTTCLKTFSYQFKDDTAFDSLKDQLAQAGIVCEELSTEEKWKLIQEAESNEGIARLLSLFNTFLNLFKSDNLTYSELEQKAKKLDGFHKKRTLAFLELFRPLYFAYEDMLMEHGLIDFSDMINRATEHVSSGQYVSRHKYIIIDEFQDISYGRYKLLNAFKSQDPSLKIFAVGDDWQSIFRFTGSDVGIFNSFKNYFGFTHVSKIETTYRFGNPLLELSSDFIKSNPNQIKKSLKSKANRETHFEVFYTDEIEMDDTKALEDALVSLIQHHRAMGTNSPTGSQGECNDIRGQEFLLLGRYNFDIKGIRTENTGFQHKDENTLVFHYDDETQIDLPFMTIHGSKGLEADYVIILNCKSGEFGFPSEIVDDPVLSLVLEDSENHPNSEERRLFYVALSRARKKVFCISSINYTSKFILEIERQPLAQPKTMRCPRCRVGNLVKRKGPSKEFYGCSNYATYKCGYMEWLDN